MLVFLYFLNAFIQTGYITLQETVVGILWVLFCYVLSRTVGPMTLLASSFAASILWANFVESVPTTDFHTFYGHATRLSTGEFVELFKTKSPPTVGYYAVFHWLLGPSYATNYIGSAAGRGLDGRRRIRL